MDYSRYPAPIQLPTTASHGGDSKESFAGTRASALTGGLFRIIGGSIAANEESRRAEEQADRIASANKCPRPETL